MFHKFIEFGSSNVYPLFVKYPKNAKEGLIHKNEFIMTGMNDGVGLMDTCCVTMET